MLEQQRRATKYCNSNDYSYSLYMEQLRVDVLQL